ncbi:orotidine-5'-phosphate decarboxylase [Aneurinibacillus sp. Ricciae_BoGa-3]|uniref:orotidine-5'-phosphate decarboxylase n=1 Tax=Aneurinibacillus sp. Ricciae_BoGa-3 TaxID=3022697 RepID=UPI00234029E6|nr:orotidine-5'-phosphate decarboxylase [Aneurinibacillus sp. Ricciae_BoGa-3]WCK53050.1 orotidine-5'-phosphate decarboxylase [Aneurinibacillus sp. Ricciae_BoGa-3]
MMDASRIMVALDYPGVKEASSCVQDLSGSGVYLKVGMQLYYAAGPAYVAALKENGYSVFLDLKVHDIPNTASGAMQSLASLGVDMVNVHAAGGRRMMEAAREGLEKGTPAGGKRSLLIGVTQLTSTNIETMNWEIGIPGSVEECVVRYAQLVKDSGLDGVVASPREVPLIKQACGADFLTVTPGIRPAGADAGDQQRITTPEEAIKLGSDYLVIGRAITQAAQPRQALDDIVQQISSLGV